MKNKAITAMAFICCLTLPLLAQNKKDGKNNIFGPAGVGTFVTLTDGDVTVSVNSFGQAGNTSACGGFGFGFSVGEADSVLCAHLDFLSTGGPVKPISPAPAGVCTVISPVTADAANHATSEVQCGDCVLD